jgi:hypothetical protein
MIIKFFLFYKNLVKPFSFVLSNKIISPKELKKIK